MGVRAAGSHTDGSRSGVREPSCIGVPGALPKGSCSGVREPSCIGVREPSCMGVREPPNESCIGVRKPSWRSGVEIESCDGVREPSGWSHDEPKPPPKPPPPLPPAAEVDGLAVDEWTAPVISTSVSFLTRTVFCFPWSSTKARLSSVFFTSPYRPL